MLARVLRVRTPADGTRESNRTNCTSARANGLVSHCEIVSVGTKLATGRRSLGGQVHLRPITTTLLGIAVLVSFAPVPVHAAWPAAPLPLAEPGGRVIIGFAEAGSAPNPGSDEDVPQGVPPAPPRNVRVLNAVPCTLSLSASVPSTATIGTSVSFASAATASGCSGSVTYAWTFGDGATAATGNAAHTYTTAGSYSWRVTATVAGVSATKNGTINVTGNSNGWVLTWSDEFDGTALDSSAWWAENSTTSEYGGALQAWTPANVVVENGLLRLMSKRESLSGMQYTSGAVNTFGGTAFRPGATKQTFGPYGRFEFRAKLPKGKGLWPAIWFVEDNPSSFAEIDVMEMHGDVPSKLYETSHVWTGGSQRVWGSCSAVDTVDYSVDFHVWAVEISSTSLVWYVDGVKRCEATGGFPTKPLYILLNTSIGGTWAGSPDATTPFPQSFDIDYVRFYVK